MKNKLKKEAVRSQDSVTIICAVSANVSSNRSADIAWNFIKENWPTLYKRYSTGFILTRLVKVKRRKIWRILMNFYLMQL